MEIRLAFPNEQDQILAILADADGQEADTAALFEDILEGRGHVALIDGEIVAYAAAVTGHHAAFDELEEGRWQHNHHVYVTIRSLAVAPGHRGRQVAQTLLQGLIEGHDRYDFRTAVAADDAVMQHILKKLGFVYCGRLPLDGNRLAYQKIRNRQETSLYQEIDETL